jgi:2-iminobutanoate/2-iminopropanoate deaminase
VSTIERIISPDVAEPPPELWSNCLVVDKIAYFSGLTARGKDQTSIEGSDEYEQTKIIFGKFKSLLKSAGGSMADITQLTIFVSNIRNREAVWKARREFFKGNFPACALVQVASLASAEVLVEIQGIAHLGSGKAAS